MLVVQYLHKYKVLSRPLKIITVPHHWHKTPGPKLRLGRGILRRILGSVQGGDWRRGNRKCLEWLPPIRFLGEGKSVMGGVVYIESVIMYCC